MVSNGSKTYTIDFKKHKLLSEMDFADGENLLEANAQQNAFAYLKGSNLYVRTFDVTSNALTKEKKSHDFQLSEDGRALFLVSRLPDGSSARMTAGLLTKALATATRFQRYVSS